MDIKNKVLETIKYHGMFDEGAHIVLGLSGGPDSMCLFDVLLELSAATGYHIHPVHINHKLRPKDAEQDQEFVEEICRRRGLNCRTFVVDCNRLAREKGLTSEEAGRKARYEAFFEVAEEIAKEMAAEKIAIAVAQNANDQAETILFRILRGTGTDGLAGIAYKRYERGIPVVRPLLDVPREEIEKYCRLRNLSPRIDHTNNEAIYARNKIRLELLPLLREKFNPNILETLDRLGKNAAVDRDYIRQQAEIAYREIADKSSKNDMTASADVSRLSALHRAVRIRVYNLFLSEIGMTENISEGQLESIEKVRLSQSPSAMCDLAEGYAVYKEYKKIIFCRKDEQRASGPKYRMSFVSPKEYAAKEYATGGEHSQVGVFAIPRDARDFVCVRKRRDGDVIAIAGGGAFGGSAETAAPDTVSTEGRATATSVRHKKLQDFFVDAKVPKNKRDEIDLLAYGNKILWVLPSPYFTSEGYRRKGRFSAEFRPPDRLADDPAEIILILEIL